MTTPASQGMLRVKGWARFQHYKNRKPPWIRLYRELLDNKDWHKLSYASRSLAVALWLIASEHENPEAGLISDDYEELAFRVRMKNTDVVESIKELIKHGFLDHICEDQPDLLAPCYQHATPESESESESEDNPYGLSSRPERKKAIECPAGVEKGVWSDFQQLRKQKRSPITQTALEGFQREAGKAGIGLNDALKECCARGWQGFNAEWFNKNAKGNSYGNATGQAGRPSKSERARAAAFRGAGLNAGEE
jgi:hypothetical protein